MASILDEINAEVESELSQQTKEEIPKNVLQEAEQEVETELQQTPVEEPKSDFFESTEKFLEPAAPAQKSNADIFLGLIGNKRPEEIDESDKEFFNALGDEDQYKVAQARKDIPLDDAQARKIFEIEKSKMPSAPTSWEDWYNLGGDAFDVVKNVAKLGAKVGLGAAEFGRDVVKASDMQVSDEEFDKNLKRAKSSFYSFMAPAFEIPESVLWATQKAKEGGFGWADAAGEKLGLVSPEDRFENWKGRRLVSQAQAEYFREHPTIYGRLLDSPLAKDALSYIAKSQMESPEELAKRTNISVEKARLQQDAMARQQVDQLTSEMESELPEENIRVRTAGEFLLPGEVGMGTMGAVSIAAKSAKNIAQGLKYIGKSADEIAEINKAAQALQKTRFAEMMQKRTQRAEAVARGAGKVEEAMQRFKPITEKATGILGKVAPPVLGGLAGYSVSGESPMTGILTGALGGTAARSLFKGTKLGLQIPTFVREVAEARKVAPLGKTFETLGKTAEGSALKAKILSRGGKTIDNILSNSVEYARSGIHGTTLALATGALESADPEEMKQMLADGLAITLGGRALQHIKGKMMGNDPIIAQRERISDDSRIHRRYQEADPETQSNLDQISDFDNAILFRQKKLVDSEIELTNSLQSNDAKKIKLAQSMVEANKMALDHVKRANVQTRNEFGREFLKTYANLQDIANGVLKTGQNNVGFNILSTDQIYQKLRNDPANNNVPDADLVQMASQAGFYSNPAQQGLVFDRKKPSIVINADSIRERINLFGESPTEALNHETSHFIDLVPEFQSALAPVRSMLFQNEIRDATGNIKATTSGLFSKAKLVELFNDGYLRHLDPQGKEAFTKLNKLWDESRGQLDENKVAEYMKSELMADLLGEVSSRHLSKDLDSATLAMWDRARIKAKKNLLDRAIDRFYGFGGRGDIVTAANTRAEFPPEAMAAARDAMRQIVALNAEISPPAQQADMPAISKAQMMKNSALLNRFGKDSPLFKSEFKVKVFDKDGNQIGESFPVTTPNPLEGTFQSTDTGFKKLSGYGDIPVEAQGMQVPDGGTLVVARDLVMQPDGVTPVMYEAKEAKKVSAERKKLITEALDTDDYGTPNRFEPVSEGSETYRGTFTPAQIKAIQDMPESLVPKTLKENMLKVNEAIARGDGTRFIVDYAAVMNDNGKYQAFSPKMYDLVPIGMHLSKAGNFLVTTISVGRIFDKMRLWNERMPGRLSFWDNNLERTFDDFVKYLKNWEAGKPGKTNLDPDAKIAEKKAIIFNDLLNLYDKATEYSNLERTTIPRRKGDPRAKDANRTIMSIRVDHIAELFANENATKLPVNYGFAKINFMPERMEGEVPKQEERPAEQERIVAATYTDPRTGEIREGVNHKAANPNAPDEQTDRESRYYGFKTDTGRVVDREEAYRIAEESGQLKKATSEEDKFNTDRGVLHSNMVEIEPTIAEKIISERNAIPSQNKIPDFSEMDEVSSESGGGEADTFKSGNTFYKDFRNKQQGFGMWKDSESSKSRPATKDEFLIRVALHNKLFPQSKIEIISFDNNGVITKQKQVEGEQYETDDVRDLLKAKGWDHVKGDTFKHKSGVMMYDADYNGATKYETNEYGEQIAVDWTPFDVLLVPPTKPTIGEKTETSPKMGELTIGEKIETVQESLAEANARKKSALEAFNKKAQEESFDSPEATKLYEKYDAIRKEVRDLEFEVRNPGAKKLTLDERDKYLSDLESLNEGVPTQIVEGSFGPRDTGRRWKKGKKIADSESLGDKFEVELTGGVLFRGVTKEDWERIQKQGYIDTDGRGVISPEEEINLATSVVTAETYIPHGKQGVVLAIDPKGLDLFMIGADDYLRASGRIPIDNVVKVSGLIGKDSETGTPFIPSETFTEIKPTISKKPKSSEMIDADYMKAVESNDVETQQKLVDEAAKKAGYSDDVYHGTFKFKGYEFKPEKRGESTKAKSAKMAYFFTSNPKIAESYFDLSLNLNEKGTEMLKKADSYRSSGDENSARKIERMVFDDELKFDPIYWSMQKTGQILDLKINTENLKKIPSNVYDEKSFSEQLKIAKDENYDGVIFENTLDPGADTKEYAIKSDVYALFDAAKIKLSDPVTYDDAGNVIPLSQRFNPKTSDIRFMPERPVGKTQVGYDYSYLDEAIAKGKDGRVALTRPLRADEALPLLSQRIPITEEVDKDSFDYTRPAEVVFYQHENKPVSFKFDPELIEKPVFKDAAIEHAGKNVQLAMADRQTATGGDMGGIIFPWLKSNANAIITGDDGINYRVVWGNNEWKPVLSMKKKNKQFDAYNLLTYLMGKDAHASNTREVRNISNEIENAQISREQKDLFLILANAGVKKQKRADQQKNIKTAIQNIEKSRKAIEKTTDKDKIDKLNKKIQIQEKAIKLAESKFNNFLESNEEALLKKIITKYKTSFTRFQNKTGSEGSFKKNEKELIDFKKTKAFKNLIKSIQNKQLIILDNTFKGRKSSIEEILGLTIDGFNVNEILDKTMDFKNGRVNQIVGSVELSRNPDLMAVYLGNDPKQARNMTAQEAKAAAQLKADPNFVPHEAYSWAMLGPVDGNNFLNSNPKTHLEYFPDFREAYANAQTDASKKQKILEGNETTLMGAMRDNTQMPLAMPPISDKK